MALPSSGAISLNQMHVEAGGTSGTQCTINDTDIRDMISKGSGSQMSFSEWYGASSGPVTEYGGTPITAYIDATNTPPYNTSVIQTYYNNHTDIYAVHLDIQGMMFQASEIMLTRRGVEAGWGSSPSYNIPYDWPDIVFPYQSPGGWNGQDAAYLYQYSVNYFFYGGQDINLYRGGPRIVDAPQGSNMKNVFISDYSNYPNVFVDPNKIDFPAYSYGGWNYFFKANDTGASVAGSNFFGVSYPVYRTTSSTYPF